MTLITTTEAYNIRLTHMSATVLNDSLHFFVYKFNASLTRFFKSSNLSLYK